MQYQEYTILFLMLSSTTLEYLPNMIPLLPFITTKTHYEKENSLEESMLNFSQKVVGNINLTRKQRTTLSF